MNTHCIHQCDAVLESIQTGERWNLFLSDNKLRCYAVDSDGYLVPKSLHSQSFSDNSAAYEKFIKILGNSKYNVVKRSYESMNEEV